jgi:hypothetical protein
MVKLVLIHLLTQIYVLRDLWKVFVTFLHLSSGLPVTHDKVHNFGTLGSPVMHDWRTIQNCTVSLDTSWNLRQYLVMESLCARQWARLWLNKELEIKPACVDWCLFYSCCDDCAPKLNFFKSRFFWRFKYSWENALKLQTLSRFHHYIILMWRISDFFS